MKAGTGIAMLLLGFALLPGGLPAGEDADDAGQPKTLVHRQLNHLIRQDAGVIPKTAAPATDEPANGAVKIFMLEPMIVEEPKLKNLPPPEPPVQRFLRTGTIWEKVGPKFTQRFWVDSGRGFGFTLSW